MSFPSPMMENDYHTNNTNSKWKVSHSKNLSFSNRRGA